jgi:predicted dienelactone hydrolase
MRRQGFIGLLFAVIASAPAAAAGLSLVTVPADTSGPEIIVTVWYPSPDKPAPVSFGSIPMMAARDGRFDGPPDGKRLPLIVLSHGAGGSSVVLHHTAERLADAGFVVAAPNHPGDWVRDRSQYHDLSVYVQRPLQVKRAIDHMTGASPLATAIDPDRIGIYGFSRGGYTALVAIGANPDFSLALPRCEGRTDRICQQIRAREYPAEPLTHDRRIKAAVVADPASIFFTAEALAGITVPVQLWGSETGGDGVDPKTVQALDTQLKAPHTFTKVENGGHFSFLTACPPGLTEPDFCADAPGFDRAQFHERFNAALIAFFRANL